MSTRTALFDPIDLDHLSDAPDDYHRAAEVFKRLASYCEMKRRSVQHRMAGNASVAELMEAKLEGMYSALPLEYRWRNPTGGNYWDGAEFIAGLKRASGIK